MTATFDAFSAPDILVNNEIDFTDSGSAVFTQKLLRAKGQDRSAVVLNVFTMNTHVHFPLLGWSGYPASKMAQLRFFGTVRFEHLEVRFVSIYPGSVQTDGFGKTGAKDLPGEEAEFLQSRFVWCGWDIVELDANKEQIIKEDLLLLLIEGFDKGF
ncbi:hypothetical protein NKR23_g9492 [Pleurostoma richardsiae]|uniref:Uncharacterized protein n=1 Tax=Pleurostoma richardsiae TaxID=41990 RepID=A0AA38R6R5_9PEZI|nr:hypothetical protein NKR23_g9492 [Pleurostoma richardsiae]